MHSSGGFTGRKQGSITRVSGKPHGELCSTSLSKMSAGKLENRSQSEDNSPSSMSDCILRWHSKSMRAISLNSSG
eukprot:scaffold64_cov338-Pavlova_lutheri.AAC.71